MSAMRLQQSVVEWLRIARPGCLWFHAPARTDFAPRLRNGLARLGIGAGVPDLVFLLPGGRVACVVLREEHVRTPARALACFPLSGMHFLNDVVASVLDSEQKPCRRAVIRMTLVYRGVRRRREQRLGILKAGHDSLAMRLRGSAIGRRSVNAAPRWGKSYRPTPDYGRTQG